MAPRRRVGTPTFAKRYISMNYKTKIKQVISSDPIWYRRIVSRSVLWLHLIFLSRAVCLWLARPDGHGHEYARLHSLVDWMPLPPDMTWSILCTLASVVGIFGWWRQRHDTYLLALVFSASVLVTVSVGTAVSSRMSGAWLQWAAIALCVIAEVRIAPKSGALDEAELGLHDIGAGQSVLSGPSAGDAADRSPYR